MQIRKIIKNTLWMEIFCGWKPSLKKTKRNKGEVTISKHKGNNTIKMESYTGYVSSINLNKKKIAMWLNMMNIIDYI